MLTLQRLTILTLLLFTITITTTCQSSTTDEEQTTNQRRHEIKEATRNAQNNDHDREKRRAKKIFSRKIKFKSADSVTDQGKRGRTE